MTTGITDETKALAQNITAFANKKVPSNTWYATPTAKNTIEIGSRGADGVYKIEIDSKKRAKIVLPMSNMSLTDEEFDKAIKYTESVLKCMKELQAVEEALQKAKLIKKAK